MAPREDAPGSGVHRVAAPVVRSEGSLEDDWDRLVVSWEARGYGDAPPKCMAHYADAVIEALSVA